MVTVEQAPGGLWPSYPLRTERLDLRPHRPDDLEDLFAFHSRPEVVRYVPWPLRDREQTKAALQVKLGQVALTAPGQWLVLAIELRETGTVIGEVLLKWASDTDRQGEIGFALHSDFHGRGLAAEAARAVLRLGFEDLGLHRICGVCIEGNVSSVRLLERLGMRLEGRLTQSVFFKGEWADQLVLAMVEDDWRQVAGDARGLALTTDREEIAAVVHTFFAAFTSGPESASWLDRLRGIFLPGAVIVRTCGSEPLLYSVDDFIAPRQALLSGGSLSEFREWELSGRTEVYGDIAQHFCSYEKSGVQDGKAMGGRGMKTLQLVRTSDGWRISAAAWDDER